MAVNMTEYFTKMQQEGLATVKQTQDASIATIEKFRALGKEFSQPGTVPSFENLPTPTQLVEMSFGFAAQLLELRKAYTLKIAEMFVETQKQAEATVKQATSPVSNGMPISQKTAVK
ncbi:MAG TPA: hypothetical protein VJP76_04075 [Candidatus Tumulicola sp.]|nr:hypothetical protein [Candidatus Tumulicola sp.]